MASPTPARQPLFVDITEAAGVVSTHATPTGGLASMTAGVAAGDFNGDDLPDLFLTMGGLSPDRLFINRGDGTFSEEGAAWGVAHAHVGGSISVGDYDADGALDLFVTSLATAGGIFAPGLHRLYRNNTDGTFTQLAAEAGIAITSPILGDAFGSAFGDYDLDGDLDLFVSSWQFNSGGNRLFRNRGDGTFEDVTGAAIPSGLNDMEGFAPRFADMDGDGWPELLIAGDFFSSRYLINLGDGAFLDFTSRSGTGLASNGMGAAMGDVDGDGLLDWYVTSVTGGFADTGNMLYRNLGGHLYEEISQAAGVSAGGFGWGADIADFDNDGDLDIVEVNGTASPPYDDDPMYLWLQQPGLVFHDATEAAGLDWISNARSAITLDYDADGDLDVAVASNNQPFKLFRNDLSAPGANWLRVSLDRGTDARVAPNGFGTRVRVVAGGMTQMRFLDGGETYQGQSELVLHFGLGDAVIAESVVVTWASGRETTLSNVPVNQAILIEGCGADLDADGSLTALDFIAFQGFFQSGHPWADCTGDAQLDILDFSCFQTLFAQGCP